MQVIDEDEYTPAVFYSGGSHTLTRDAIGTRYVLVAVRILVDPERGQIDPVRRLIGAASAWGGNPEKDALARRMAADHGATLV